MIVRLAPNHAAVLERLGRFRSILPAGTHFIAPVIDRVAARYSLESQSLPFDVNVIALDNSTMKLTGTVKYQIANVERAHYSVADVRTTVAQLLRTALIAEAGKQRAGDLLMRDVVRAANEIAQPMGIKIVDVELQR